MKSYWRQQAAPIIRQVLEETKGMDEKVVRKKLREAYPFGPREHHPYKIWCDEVRSQLGIKRYPVKKNGPTKLIDPDPRQQEMF